MRLRSARRRTPAAVLILAHLASLIALSGGPAVAGPYVTETSGIRWNDVGGLRWNDVGGIRWSDVGGIRWNDVGGVRWNDVGGVRWNDVGALLFDGALKTGVVDIDLDLLSRLSFLPDSSSINV